MFSWLFPFLLFFVDHNGNCFTEVEWENMGFVYICWYVYLLRFLYLARQYCCLFRHNPNKAAFFLQLCLLVLHLLTKLLRLLLSLMHLSALEHNFQAIASPIQVACSNYYYGLCTSFVLAIIAVTIHDSVIIGRIRPSFSFELRFRM